MPLVCIFCFPISDHVMLSQRTISFKCHPIQGHLFARAKCIHSKPSLIKWSIAAYLYTIENFKLKINTLLPVSYIPLIYSTSQ